MPDAVCFDSLLLLPPPGFTGICSNVVTFSAVPTCLFRILFQFIWLLFFTSHHTTPATPFSLTWITISKWFVWECGVFFPFAGWKKLTWITRLSQQMKFFECKTHTNSFWLYCCLVVIIGYLFNQALWPLWGCFSLFFKFCVRKKLWRHWRRQYQRFSNETLCYLVFWKKDKVFFSA